MRKNIFTKITALLICGIFIISQSAVLVYAADDNAGFRVTGGSTAGYSSTGTAQTLVFNGTAVSSVDNTNTGDLFVNFKGLMPGDKDVKQTVVIQNQSNEPISVYVYAEPTSTDDTTYAGVNSFLSYFDMTITHGTRNLYQGEVVSNPVNNSWDQRNPIALGTISRGSQATLDITLDVDINMPNGYQLTEGSIRWVFVINGETYPTYIPETPTTPTPTPETPTTPVTPASSPNVVTPEATVQTPATPTAETPTVTPEPDISIADDSVPLNPPPVVIPDTPDAEIVIDDPTTPLDAPKTGDTAKIVMWSVLLVVFVAALVCMVVIRVKNGKKSSEASGANQLTNN